MVFKVVPNGVSQSELGNNIYTKPMEVERYIAPQSSHPTTGVSVGLCHLERCNLQLFLSPEALSVVRIRNL
jgi:hypothetical protein